MDPTKAGATASERPGIGYQPALDGLRAFAALSVLGFHLRLPGFASGDVGVDVFFTLSGFLITSLLIASLGEGTQLNYRAFYAARALRLLPAYLLVVVTCIIADFFIDVGGTLKGAVASFFYVANWAVGIGQGGLGSLTHTWSLSIEEQFYIVWPVMLVVLVKLSRARSVRLPTLILAITGISVALTYLARAFGTSPTLITNATPLRAVELLGGCYLAALLHEGKVDPLTFRKPMVSAVGWISLMGLVLIVVWGSAAGEGAPMMWILSTALTCGAIWSGLRPGIWPSRLLSTRSFVAVGKVSYGLYLWHFPILASIDRQLGLDSFGPRMLGLALTAMIVPLSYFVIERPFLRIKKRMRMRDPDRKI